MNEHDNLIATLLELGNNSEEVANNLAMQGIKGESRSSISCPIANYLTSKGYKLVRVSGWISIDDGRIACQIPTDVARFIARFDTGVYPNLKQ